MIVLEKSKFTFLNSFLRKLPFLVKRYFGISVIDHGRIFWDFTTLVLKGCLDKIIKAQHSVLEIGTGPYGILAIYLRKKFSCEVLAIDINRKYIQTAEQIADLNNVSVTFLESNLFSNINTKFDIIFFNSIYIPYSTGKKLNIEKIHSNLSDWCGGESGLDTINQFLKDGLSYLTVNGKLLLGFNPRYVSEKSIIDISNRFGYKTIKIYSKFANPCKVLVLTREN